MGQKIGETLGEKYGAQKRRRWGMKRFFVENPVFNSKRLTYTHMFILAYHSVYRMKKNVMEFIFLVLY